MTDHLPALRTRHAAALAAVLGLLLSAAVLVAPPAHAETRTVTLTSNGPVPARLVLAAGDRVRFYNGDTVQHRVTSGSGWRFDSGALAPNTYSANTALFSAPGTYRYTDARSLLLTVATFSGSLVLPAPPPSPSPTRSASPRPTARPSTSPAPSPATSATGTPVLPVVPTGFPTASPLPSTSPLEQPTVVTPSGSPLPSPAPNIRYGDPQALVQSSPHRYGLPVLIGLVGIAGVASLLLRLLLSISPASRRTDDRL